MPSQTNEIYLFQNEIEHLEDEVEKGNGKHFCLNMNAF